MKPTVYIETSIISYLTAWSSNDVLRRAHQELTKKWWTDRRDAFELLTSQFVLDEAAAGDPVAAAERLEHLNAIELLIIPPQSESLANKLLTAGAMPQKARIDALHLAVAALNGVDYLMTWNCKHLANAVLWDRMEETCRLAGYEPPRICTPLQLLGDSYDL